MSRVKISRPITVDHIARIEGKAGLEVKIANDRVKEVRMNIFEGPRFFEAITLGKPLSEATAVFPRICSFCAAAHKLTALEAAEAALDLQVTRQTQKIRELLYLGDHIESHALHLFFLALPDFFGYPDALSMAKDYGDEVKIALRLKDVGARIQTVTGSRYIHQENAILGGFGKIPSSRELESIASELRGLRKDSELALELLLNFENWPELDTERTHLALESRDDGYGVTGNRVLSSTGEEFRTADYKEQIKEHVVSHSFAKHSLFREKPFLTSALSRVTLSGDKMEGRAKELALMHSTNLDSKNIMSNNFAQALELVYFVSRAKDIAEELAANVNTSEPRVLPVFGKPGTGVAMSEAPRGLLAYTLGVDAKGRISAADIITPTAMFLPMMEQDIGRMAQGLLDRGMKDHKEIAQSLETVVRAYDPCVSCSVHVTELR